MKLGVRLRYPEGSEIFLLTPKDFNKRVGLSNKKSPMGALLVLAWSALLMDSPLDNSKPRKVLLRVLNQTYSLGLTAVIKHYSDVYDALVESERTDDDGSLSRTYLSVFESTPVFREYLHWYRTGDSDTLTYISTFLRFGKKCEFDLKGLDARALRAWHEVEDHLGEWILPVDLLHDLRLVLSALLPDPVTSETFLGKHGSGAVAGEERGAVEKSIALQLTPKLKRLLSVGAPIRLHSYLISLAEEKSLSPDSDAVLKFVPKNFKTSRSICMEPVSVMYMQQHVRQILEKTIASSLLGRFIQIDNQERNKSGARYGSKYHLVDTLDLSHASDSVSLPLIRAIFPRKWVHSLLATRTSRVSLPDGKTRTVQKFAPMGSALCFPIQSVVYTAVVVLAYLRHAYGTRPINSLSTDEIKTFVQRDIATSWVTSAKYESIAVYGDDIVCDSRCSSIVIDILTDLGFSVNVEKSFRGLSNFRESCGGFYMNGADVSPFHFKAKEITRKGWSARAIASIVALTNIAGDKGLFALRSFLVEFLLEYDSNRGKNPIMLSDSPRYLNNVDDVDSLLYSPESQGGSNIAIFSHTCDNSHLPYRDGTDKDKISSYDGMEPGKVPSHVRFQREEYRCWRLSPRYRISQQEARDHESYSTYDHYLLDLYYRKSSSADSERQEEFLSSNDDLRGAKLQYAWCAL